MHFSNQKASHKKEQERDMSSFEKIFKERVNHLCRKKDSRPKICRIPLIDKEKIFYKIYC